MSTAAEVSRDLRYAWRQLGRAPGFVALVALMLALGLAASTTVFTLVERVLLSPLPFPRPEQLVAVEGQDSSGSPIRYVSAADWRDWSRASSLDGSALYSAAFRQGIVLADDAVMITARNVTAGFFDVFAPRFILGHGFSEGGGPQPVAVVTEHLWRTALGADRSLATPLRTPRASYAVVGVVANGFEFPDGTDAWFVSTASDPVRANINWSMVARLRAGFTPELAARQMSIIARAVRATDPTGQFDYGAQVVGLVALILGEAATYLRILMGAVVIVLAVVCANVAASSLARGATRRREMAIRVALGAGRRRLIRQLVFEQAAPITIGCACGLLGAWLGVRLILARWSASIPRATAVTMDLRVVGFAVLAAILSGGTAGLIAALRSSRASHRDLFAGGRVVSPGTGRILGALVAIEVALALVLATGAGLLVRSYRAVLGRGLGFGTNVATVEATLSGPAYADSGRRVAYWERLVNATQGLPGAGAVGLSNWIPLDFTGMGSFEVYGASSRGSAVYRTVDAGYFTALGIPLIAGRSITPTDRHDTPKVVVVNATMAARYWHGRSPLGALVRATSMEGGSSATPPDWRTVVGVVGDARSFGLESDPEPEMYVPYLQAPAWRTRNMTILVSSRAAAGALAGLLKSAARSVDPTVPVDVSTLSARLRQSLSTRVLTLSLGSGFATLGVLLAALGAFGMLSYSVALRSRELAVRAALGAPAGRIVTTVLARAGTSIAWGLGLGAVAAALLTRAMTALIFGVAPLDPVAFLSAGAVLVGLLALAAVVPVARALRVDPMVAMRSE